MMGQEEANLQDRQGCSERQGNPLQNGVIVDLERNERGTVG